MSDLTYGRVGRVSQVVLGVFLLLLVLSVDYYAARDFFSFLRQNRLRDVPPIYAGAVLALSPWLLVVASRLLRRSYEHRVLVSPVSLLVIGIGLLGISVVGGLSGTLQGIALGGGACVGTGAIVLGWRRLHGESLP